MNGPTPTFEGSYLGATGKISPQAVMECKICWTVYDPDHGDETRQVLPGTAFTDLPHDWSCPNCDAPAAQFLVLRDPGAMEAASAAHMDAAVRNLVADFTEVYHAKMRDVPIINKALHVEAVGFRSHGDGYLGVLVSPWFMNLVLLPAQGDDWATLTPGAKENIAFPSGTYEFIHNTREMVGGYKACSLFSPMNDFSSQMQAVDTARAVMVALFDEGVREETDRAADIRAQREAELSGAIADDAADDDAVIAFPDAPSRRAVISGGLSSGAAAEGEDG